MQAKTKANISYAYCSTATDIQKLLKLKIFFTAFPSANQTSTALFHLLHELKRLREFSLRTN